MEESEEVSGLQRSQEKVAAALSKELQKLIPLIPAMKIEEVKQLVDCIDSTMWLEYRAAVTDARIEREKLNPLFTNN